MPDRIDADVYFAIVPEWVLYHPDLDDRAVRLYAALARHANEAGQAIPGRARLASLLGCSADSIDRALRRLRLVGAVSWERRRDDAGDPTSNLYTLRTSAPVPPGGRKGAATPSRGPAATRSRADAALTRAGRNESTLNETLAAPPQETGLVVVDGIPPLGPGWHPSDVPGLWYEVGPDGKRNARRDLLWETLLYVAGWDSDSMTDSARGAANKAVGEIRAAAGSPEEIVRRARRYFVRYGERPTPTGLARHWPALHSDDPPLRVDRRTLDRASEHARRTAHRADREVSP